MGRKGALYIELEALLTHHAEKGCSFFNPIFITFLLLCLTLTPHRCFWLCPGNVSKRVYFVSRSDKAFSCLMDVLLKSLPLLLPQKHHLVLAANVATLGLMMARILAGSAGKRSSHWQSPCCAAWAKTRIQEFPGESKQKGS